MKTSAPEPDNVLRDRGVPLSQPRPCTTAVLCDTDKTQLDRIETRLKQLEEMLKTVLETQCKTSRIGAIMKTSDDSYPDDPKNRCQPLDMMRLDRVAALCHDDKAQLNRIEELLIHLLQQQDAQYQIIQENFAHITGIPQGLADRSDELDDLIRSQKTAYGCIRTRSTTCSKLSQTPVKPTP